MAEPATGWGTAAAQYAGIVIGYVLPPIITAFLSGYLVLRWKGRGEYLDKRLDELCAMIDSAAEFGSDYWSIDQSVTGALINEAKLQAQLMKIAGLRASLESEMSQSSIAELRRAESVFLREATGGNFGVHNRVSDLFRAIATRHSAAQFVVAIRAARMRDLRGWQRRT